jgi:hypothetical protein
MGNRLNDSVEKGTLSNRPVRDLGASRGGVRLAQEAFDV